MGSYTDQQALNKIANDGIKVSIVPANAIEVQPGMGMKNVALAGTAEPLKATQTFALGVFIQANPTNTGKIYLGVSSVSSSSYGALLSRGEWASVDLPIGTKIDLNKLYIDSDVNGEGVSYFITGA